MARTYPAVAPYPALYRVLFFAPLFLVEFSTLPQPGHHFKHGTL